MSDRIGGLGGGFQPGFTPGGAQAQVSTNLAKGQYQSEAVSVGKDPTSMLQDAAEELTFGAHEFRTKRELGERKLRDAEGSSQIETVKRIQEYLEQLPDIDPRQLRDLYEQMRDSGEKPSREALQRRLSGFHEDITYQQAALEFLATELEKAGDDPELLDVVRGALVENERAFGPEIRAGLNVTGAAMATGASSGEVQDLREMYRNTVLKHESIRQSFQNIVERYGEEDLGDRIGFLLTAMGEDLSARGPSIPPPELKIIMDDMHQLETLSTLRERSIVALQRLDQRYQAL
ncbi:MAG TPA: type III secretion system gatekeeper subunit SctW [Geminicoccaceae bacterium]|nr:type III secretion system gatekeeper subunit SctW [Geminicoccus sp.]HMU48208.1 type III secretion system gatekeeper subunit SctW [Geminicoccaceae bacterium]